MKDVLLLVAVAYAAAALLLPISAIEVLGVALVVAGAYFGGLRGGIATAAWATLVATAAFLLLPDAAPAGYVLSVAAYLLVGLGLGWGVGRFAEQRRRLQEVAERAEAAQRQLAASQKRYRLLFESSNDAVYLHGLDADGEPTRFVAVNDAACTRLGYTREEMLGLTVRAIDVPETPGQMRRIMERLLREDRIVYEAVRKTRDGRRIPVEVSSSLTDVDGELLVLSISRDISGRKKAERRLEHLSMHDDLTGLTNRRGFYVLLPEQGKRAKRSGERLFVLYADIDGFKAINDSLGHKRGDDVLVGIAHALRSTFRETDLVARLGGDEFCVVAEADKDPAALTDRLEAALVALSRRLGLEVTLSYGVLSTDWAGLDDPDELLTRADMLMYEAKRAKKGERSAGPARGAASA
jgi:diguanylate cyclase (GGDEF)-like protein/PAS domain S-box-containing protein